MNGGSTNFWQWLLDQDPENLSIRSEVGDPEIAAMLERAQAEVSG